MSRRKVAPTPRHRIAHLLGWNEGRVDTWREGPRLMVGFRCSGCGRVRGAEEIVWDAFERAVMRDRASGGGR